MVELVKGECSLCAGVEVIDEELVLGSWGPGVPGGMQRVLT